MRGRRALAALIVPVAAVLTLTACGDAQEVCDGVDLSQEAQEAATAATAHGFEVELEVEDETVGTAECVWDNPRKRLIGSTDSE